jgi:hypothetical protein
VRKINLGQSKYVRFLLEMIIVGRKQKKKGLSIVNVGRDFDWRTLVDGDSIYLVKGHGPFCIYTSDVGENITECMGEYGWFRVKKVDGSGVHAYNEYGFHYIYLGPEVNTRHGLVRSPHKIGKVKRKKVDE